MSSKNKKKSSVINKKNLIVISMAAVFVAVVAFGMSFLLPNEETENFDKVAWEEAINDAEQNLEEKYGDDDSGLISVYPEEAVATTAEALPETAKPPEENSEEKADETENQSKFMRPSAGKVVKDFSGDELVYSATMQDWRTHNGIDFSAQIGDIIIAAADGTVEAITDNSMMGTTVILLHDGGIRTIYSNLDEDVIVNAGTEIMAGTAIGIVGDTAVSESAEEPHLHFEVSLNEEYVNPIEYIGE